MIGHGLLLVAAERVDVMTVGPLVRRELKVGRALSGQHHHLVERLVLGRLEGKIVDLVYVAAHPQRVRHVDQLRLLLLSPADGRQGRLLVIVLWHRYRRCLWIVVVAVVVGSGIVVTGAGGDAAAVAGRGREDR